MRCLWFGVLGLPLVQSAFIIDSPFRRLNVRFGGFVLPDKLICLLIYRARIAPKTLFYFLLACLFCKPFLHFSCYIKAAACADNQA